MALLMKLILGSGLLLLLATQPSLKFMDIKTTIHTTTTTYSDSSVQR